VDGDWGNFYREHPPEVLLPTLSHFRLVLYVAYRRFQGTHSCVLLITVQGRGSFENTVLAAKGGGHFVALRQSSISQTLHGLVPNRTYRVSWLALALGNTPAPDGELGVAMDGTDRFFANPSHVDFVPLNFTVTAAATWATLTFSGRANSAVLIDDVAVCDVCMVVDNADFEDNAGALPNVWNINGIVRVQQNNAGLTSGDGNSFAVIGGGFSIMSQIVFGLEIGREYTVSFHAAGVAGNPDAMLQVALSGISITSNIAVTSTFERYSFRFNATESHTNLKVANVATSSLSELYVDMVSVCPVADVTLPAALSTASLQQCDGVRDPLWCLAVSDCTDTGQPGTTCPGLCPQYCNLAVSDTTTAATTQDSTQLMMIIGGVVVVVAMISVAMVRRSQQRLRKHNPSTVAKFSIEPVTDNPAFSKNALTPHEMLPVDSESETSSVISSSGETDEEFDEPPPQSTSAFTIELVSENPNFQIDDRIYDIASSENYAADPRDSYLSVAEHSDGLTGFD
jgi:hypothetical protein